jgi:probable blue pigment (indigoidine) exporter
MAARDWFLTALAPVLWGTMPAAAAQAFAPGHPLLIAAVRSLGAGIAILLVCRQPMPRNWYARIVVLGVVNIALTFSLFFMSASRVGGGLITVLMALSPFWAALIGLPLLGERPRAQRFCWIAGGLVGVMLMVGASPVRLDALGIVAGVGASVCMGCGVVLFKKWGRLGSLIVFTGWQLLAGGMFLGVLALTLEDMPAQLTNRNISALLYLVGASTILAYTLWFRGIERLGAQRTSMLLLLVPVVGLAVDVLFLGRQLSNLQYLGGAAVLASLLLDASTANQAAAIKTIVNLQGEQG